MTAVGTGRARPVVGSCRVPPDKSISHRAAILAAMANGASTVQGFSTAGDCRSTLAVLRAVGVTVVEHERAPAGADGITIRVDGPFEPWPDTDLGDEVRALTRGAETEILELAQHDEREAVIDLCEIEITEGHPEIGKYPRPDA